MTAVLDIVVCLVISYIELFDANTPADLVSVFLCLLFQPSILRKLVTVTDPACGYEDGMVSPLYMAINKQDKKSMEILLREGYSPDGQDCQQLLGLRSPLSFASFEMFGSPYRSVR